MAAGNVRLYLVTLGGVEYLSRAASLSGAVRGVVEHTTHRNRLPRLATKDDIERLLRAGAEIIEGPYIAQPDLPLE